MSISELSKAWANHNRKFADFRFVYPVISRRAKGLSIGINCTPNGACSFRCVYCQTQAVVDTRHALYLQQWPTINEIISEIKKILSIYNQTKLAEHFPGIPEESRVLRDIALSGDGEPTLYPHFAELCEALSKLPEKPKLTLITNATQICEGLGYLTEIWGKLDAGTDEFLQFIDRPQKNIDIATIENNLKSIVSKHPLRIQTMLCEAKGRIPNEAEIESYAQIVQRVYETNPKNLLSLQIYSIVRQAAENSVKPLSKEFLESVKNILQNKIANLTIEVF
jgi:wyosine [tRNA(Phe)-imidazoG37] synthetase (radical SAM superfamily)